VSGQLSQVGAQMLANKIAGNAPPAIQTSAPTWIPGLDWVDTTSGAVLKTWNGAAWVVGPATRYTALLTASPFTSGPGGGAAQAISDLVEVTTAGYSRQVVTFSNAGAAYPSPVSNNAVLTFGPVSAAMTLAAQWAALVTHAPSGTSGLLLYFWQLDTPQQVSVSQSIQVPISNLALLES
jgi:hypothetical protein